MPELRWYRGREFSTFSSSRDEKVFFINRLNAMAQYKAIYKLIIMVGLLVSCQSSQQLSEESQSGALSGLPVTWTQESIQTPVPSSTIISGNGARGTPSPTPEYLPSTPTRAYSSLPTQTPFSYYELPLLIAGNGVTINRIHMINSKKGWATGSQEAGHQRVLFTEDGGYTWQDRTPQVLVPVGYYTRNDNIIAPFFDESSALVLIGDTQAELDKGNYFVWKTEDSGLNWSRSTPLPFPMGWYFIFPGGFSFINSAKAFSKVAERLIFIFFAF